MTTHAEVLDEIYNADLILQVLNIEQVPYSRQFLIDKIRSTGRIKGAPVPAAVWFDIALDKLERDHFIKVSGRESEFISGAAGENIVYQISFEGSLFIRLGGYAAKMKEDDRLRKLHEEQLQTVVDTNKSVMRTNHFQMTGLVLTLVVAAVSCWVSWLAYKKTETINVLPSSTTLLPIRDRIHHDTIWMAKDTSSTRGAN